MQIEWVGVGALLIWAIGVAMGRYLWPRVKKTLTGMDILKKDLRN